MSSTLAVFVETEARF